MKQITKLGLGTVQWGTVYGIANRGSITQEQEVTCILDAASAAGVDLLDTAALYGTAEEVLGRQSLERFRIVTKTPRLMESPSSRAAALLRGVNSSLQKLGVDSVYSVLIHNADDLLVEGASAIVHALESLKSTGKVRKIGVSVYESAQVRAVLELFTPDIVQAPVNVLDQRLIADGTLAMLRSRGVEIHSRSVFLQGLLLMPLDEVPRYFDPIRPLLRRWHRRCREQTMSPSEAAFSFVKGLGEVDCCLVGVQSLAQFQQCLRDFSNANSFDSDSLSCDDPAFLNPSKWSRH